MAGGKDHKKRAQRSYRPTVEAMEALRMLSDASAATFFPGVVAEHELRPISLPLLDEGPTVSGATWDAALVQTHLADLLQGTTAGGATRQPDSRSMDSGLSQLNKYLARAWYRAGIPTQLHEDCSQAVYATLLQQLGRTQFDSLVSEVGRWGVKDVFSRETTEGLDFFRAVDMVKKRAQRERSYQPLDSIEVAASVGDSQTKAWRDALQEAIDHTLSPREASLINETLMGKTPAEIALHWGVAPKTVSNEKTRVIQKLRDALLTQVAD